MGQDAAFEEGVELVLDELRQAGTSGLFGLGEEGLGVLRTKRYITVGPGRWRS